MRTSYPALLLCTAAWLAVGCAKDEPAPVDLGFDYFPTTVGRWIEYQVDSQRVHIEGGDTAQLDLSYALREVITEDFTDPEGRPAQRIIRYTRDTAGNWQPKDVWWQVREQRHAEKTEENMRRVKLLFPPREGEEWNTNARNTADEFDLEYTAVDEAWSVNGLSFPNTVVVEGTYPNNFIFTKRYRERYAKGIGLVDREVDSVENQPGFSYDRWYLRQTVTSYGP